MITLLSDWIAARIFEVSESFTGEEIKSMWRSNKDGEK